MARNDGACGKYVARTIAAVLSFAYIAGAHAEAPQEKLDATLKSLQSTKENAEAIQEKLEAMQKDAARLQESATRIAEALQKSESRVTREEAHYGNLTEQIAAKQKEFDARAADYAQSIRSMLRMRNIPATAILASPENIQPLLRSTTMLRYVNAALRNKAMVLKKELETLKKLKESAAASKAVLAKEQVTLALQQDKLNADIAARQKLQQALAKDHAQALAKVKELSRASQNLQELITKLEKNRDRMAVANRTAKHLPPSAAKGSWRLPAIGTLLHRFGERKGANESWRGLVLRARAGATVVAPSGGEVVFTGPFRDYGRMVLIKHKDRHISLLAGLGNISVALNQQVGRGEPLGSMGNTSTAELYIELREEGKPVDPAHWYATNTASE